MRILMTQRELVTIAGSEMVTVEVAKALASRGHEIAVYSPKIGDVAKVLLPSGVQVLRELRDAPWEPELIYGQHHLPAMAAIARFSQSPAIYYCHGTQPWVERPPVHARIHKYIMMCEWMVLRSQTEFGLAPEQVTFVPNFVNLKRFSEVRPAPARIRNALLFGGPRLPDQELRKLEAACASLDITLDKIGHAYGTHRSRPEIFLQKYDLVFAIGKCALEAIATGCAVIPVIPGRHEIARPEIGESPAIERLGRNQGAGLSRNHGDNCTPRCDRLQSAFADGEYEIVFLKKDLGPRAMSSVSVANLV